MKTPNVFYRFLCCFFALYLALPASVVAQLSLTPPSFPASNTVRLTLTGTATNTAYVVLFSPSLTNSLPGWQRVTTGTVGQVVFDLSKTTNDAAFFSASDAPNPIPTVATPTFSPGGGSHPSPTNVTISCATDGAAIYFTTNGSTPTTLDNYIYNGGSTYLASVVTLKAKAFKSGYNDSAVASATYTINSGPGVNAGPQQIIAGSPATLAGFVTDDGLTGGGTRYTNWSKMDGPGTVTFNNASQTNTTATFSADGIYELKLEASDGQYTNSGRVTIAVNPTLSVAVTAPADGSGYTVPTNILLQATATCTSGSVTQLLFYAGAALVGTGVPNTNGFTYEWRSVPAGTQLIRAVAVSTDDNNYSLASEAVAITVNWPTNVGQLAFALNELQIPVAGLPIVINRLYDTRYGDSKSFGNNGRLDYETIHISKDGSIGQNYEGFSSGGYCFRKKTGTSEPLVIVSLSDNEKYYSLPVIEFFNGAHCVAESDAWNVSLRYRFETVGSPQGSLATIYAPSDVGLFKKGNSTYCVTHTFTTANLEVGHGDDALGCWESVYEPDWSLFEFTAPDGTKYQFDSNGNLSRHTDRNGNYLDYQYGGIVHSSNKQVKFDRDAGNGDRITAIYDPNSLDSSGNITGPAALTYAYDGAGNLTNVSRLVTRSTTNYESTGYSYTNTSYPYHITKITDPRGIAVQRYEYDSSGRLQKQYDALNLATMYSYDLTGHRQTVTDPLGNPTTQNFTLSGQVSSVLDPEGGVTQYGYDERGRKIAETNALGQATTYAYDNNDRLIGVTNALGAVSSATFNEFGQVLIVINSGCGCVGTTNDYDINGNLIAVTNPVGVVMRHGYDAQGNRTAETNAFGTAIQAVTLNQFNEFGYLTNAVDALGHSIAYTYDANGNRLTQTTTRTASTGTQTLTTTYTFDAANRVVQTVEPDGFTNKTVFNNIGKQAQTIDKLGRTNFYAYDALGLLTNTTYADGLTEKAYYDAEGRRTQSVDRAGRTNLYTYDALGRLTRTTYPDGAYTQNTYDSAGRLRRVAQGAPPGGPLAPPASELTITYSYDAAGRRTAVTNALSQGAHFAYDANDNQTNMVDALNRTNTYVYDALNRQVQRIFPDNTIESTGYDALDRRFAVTNQANVVTRFGYDSIGKLTSVTNAFGSSAQMVTRYAYDEVGNQTNQVDALSHTNLFEYDALGHRTKQTLPGNQSQTFGYDAVGNLIRQTNFNGVIITNIYDALNRLTNRSSVNGYKITLTYSPTGQRTNMVDAIGTNTYAYDSRDRLLTNATPQGTLTYTYDAYGNQATLQSTTTNGTKLNYYYDALNRLTNVVDRFTNNSFYTFDSVGNLQTSRYPNNVTNSYNYDALNRLTNISVTAVSGTLASFAYKLAPAGNRTNLIELLNGVNRTNTWAYDALYRLTNELIGASSGPTGSITNKYDAVGNRTNRASSVVGVSTVTNSFNSNDQLTTDIYDNNGNTRTNGSDTYFYDAENRLTNATVGGTNITLIYDGNGNRVKKTVGTTTTFYLIDTRSPSGYAQVLEELTTVGSTPDKLYTYGLDLISQRQSGGTTSFFGYDGNGNTRFLTGTNAAISDTYAYDAFGIVITNTGSTPNNYRYTGEQYDPNLGFYYLRARYMNPNTGRFWTRDTYEGSVFDPPSLHKYLYAVANPVNVADPSGKQGSTVETLTVGAIIVIFAARLLPTIALVVSAVCAAEAAFSTTANVVFNQDTTDRPTPCSWRGKSRDRILFHYSPLPALTGAQIWSGTALTDNPNLTAAQAKYGLGITGALPTTLYAIRVKNNEITGGTPIQPSSNATYPVDAKEWFTLVALPFSRIVEARPLLQ